MIQLPHTSEPLVDETGAPTYEMRSLLDQIKRALDPSEATAAQIADITSIINTQDKYSGKMRWDTTNNRMMRASASTPSAVWYVIDGSASVTPA